MPVQGLTVPQALARWLAGVRRQRGSGGALRILPDGCHDIIFDLARGSASVVGAMRSASLVRVAEGANLLGVRFQPGASALFLAAPAHELADRVVPLAELAKPALHELAERLAEARSAGERYAALAASFGSAGGRQRAADHRLAQAARRLQATHGALGVRELAREVGVGERQLERLFLERVGLSPKLFARIARLERALSLLDAAGARHAELAARAGYADEPHFAREVRALSGLTPRELARERRVGFVQAAAGRAG